MKSMLKKFNKYWNWKRIIKNIKYLIKYDLEEKELDILFSAKDGAVEDCVYELEENKKILGNLSILDDIETINLLNNCPKSFSRFGDGEISIIQGRDCNFQKYDPELARKLLKLLSEPRKDVYIGLNRSYFHSPFTYSEANHKFYRIYGTQYRRFFLSVCDKENTYLDACCFGGYFRLNKDYDFENLYERNKQLFCNKRIAVVMGSGLIKKLKYDVFEYAIEKIIIEAPSVNAFSEYNSLIEKVVNTVPKDYIVCLILGQTATVMAADLSDYGYIAWDIGHLPKDYNAYMLNTERSSEAIKSYWKADL